MAVVGDAEKNLRDAFVAWLKDSKPDLDAFVDGNIRGSRDTEDAPAGPGPRDLPGVNVDCEIYQGVEGTNEYRGVAMLRAETYGPSDRNLNVVMGIVGAMRDALHNDDITPIVTQLNQAASGIAFQQDGIHEANTDISDDGKINRRTLNVDVAFWVGSS